jgi:hypothetical protein
MRIVSHLAILTTVLLTVAAPVSRCEARGEARAEILPLEDKDLAKMAKEDLKRKRDARNAEQDSSDMNDSSQCGSVAIGNNDGANQRGSDRIAPNNTTVIVTGNIVNTATCGR